MSRTIRISLIAAASLLGVIVLSLLGVAWYVTTDDCRSRFESAATKALGMEYRVQGDMHLGFFPLRLVIHDVHVHNRGTELGSVEEARLSVAFLPLLVKRVDVTWIELDHPQVFIQRGTDGISNAKRSTPPIHHRPHGPMEITATGGMLRYKLPSSGLIAEMDDCDAKMHDVRTEAPDGRRIFQRISFTGDMTCSTGHIEKFQVTDLRVTGKGAAGVIDLDPITLQAFGGQGKVRVHTEFTTPVDRYALHASLPQFDIASLIRDATPKDFAAGRADFTADVAFQGRNRDEVTRSLSGQVSLQGQGITLKDYDLDGELSRLDKTQHFDLADLAAVFIAGPLGIVATKGYDFARLKKKGGASTVHIVVADWQVADGIATADDVALSTDRHRLALQGKLDLPAKSYEGVTVATVDAQGCTMDAQNISGSFTHPKLKKADLLKIAVGPVRNVALKAKKLDPHSRCKVFYSGSVIPY
jgi:hypothetical protein